MPRILLTFIAFLAIAAPAAAAEQSASDFLRAIYVHYQGDDKTARGIMLDAPADFRRYFEPSLANLILADEEAAAKRGDVPELDGDPFIDAQDWDITGLSIHIDTQDAAKAHATVRFKNFKEPMTVHVALVRLPEGWRIADIVWNGNDGTLRGLYVKR